MITLDIETSGTNPKIHSILSIGAVLFNHPKKQFYLECRMRKDSQVTNKALEVNGFSWEEINDPQKPTEKEIVRQFITWAVSSDEQDLTLMGHNICFDISFLKAAIERYKLNWLFGYRFLDLHSVAYAYLMRECITVPLLNRVSDLTLDHILQLAGMDPEPKPHNALRGARLEAEAYSRLVLRKSLKYIQRSV